MKYGNIAGAVLLAGVAGWASAQTSGRPQPAQVPMVVRPDQVALLAARVQELQNRVQTLENANDIQGGTILQLMAYRSTANGAIAEAAQKQAALQQRFDTHTHSYNYPNLVWNNRYFVTESGVTEDEKDLASYISVFTSGQQTTSAPE